MTRKNLAVIVYTCTSLTLKHDEYNLYKSDANTDT